MKRKMFLDPALQNDFNKKGFIKIPFLDQEEVQILRDFFMKTYYNKNEQYNALENRTFTEFSVINYKPESKKESFDQITNVCLSKTKKLLHNYDPIIGNFIAKYNEKGLLPIHQNWAIVNEKKYTSVSIWCPLQDTDEKNGTLYFVEGSHRYFRGNRHPQTHEPFVPIHDYLVNEHLKPVSVKAGEAIILDDAIIHYSPVNLSNNIRLAVQLIMKPAEVQAQFIEGDPNNKSIGNVYDADAEFFFQFNEFKAHPQYQIVKKLNFKRKVYTQEKFLRKNRNKKWWMI